MLAPYNPSGFAAAPFTVVLNWTACAEELSMKSLLASLVWLAIVCGCSRSSNPAPGAQGPEHQTNLDRDVGWPTRGWSTSTPEALGFDRLALEAFDREIESGAYGYVDGMLIVRHGRIAFERSYSHDYHALFVGRGAPALYNYFDPTWHPYYKRTDLHTMQSVSKSVTSALIGIAIARGEIPGVDVKVMPYFSGFKVQADPRRDRMTLRHLLTMTTGIKWDEWSSSYTEGHNNCAQMEAADDWIQYVLDQPMATEPGSAFVYNSGATEMLSFILQKATGKPADEYAREHLFAPLGIEYQWKRTPKGLADTEGGLYVRPHDLAKFGHLFLHDGMWDGTPIVPAAWVKDSTAVQADVPQGGGYGYLWWVLPHTFEFTAYPNNAKRIVVPPYDAFSAFGYGGQNLIVVPRLDLITVINGWNIYDKPELDPIFAIDRVIAAIKDNRPVGQ